MNEMPSGSTMSTAGGRVSTPKTSSIEEPEVSRNSVYLKYPSRAMLPATANHNSSRLPPGAFVRWIATPKIWLNTVEPARRPMNLQSKAP